MNELQKFNDTLTDMISTISQLRKAVDSDPDKAALYLKELKIIEDDLDDILFAINP